MIIIDKYYDASIASLGENSILNHDEDTMKTKAEFDATPRFSAALADERLTSTYHSGQTARVANASHRQFTQKLSQVQLPGQMQSAKLEQPLAET